MAITRTYTVTALRKVASLDGLTDVVSSVDLNIKAYPGVGGNVPVDWNITEIYVDAPSSGSFTPFEELTEEQVLSWVQNDNTFIEVNKLIDKKIDDIINPKEYVQQLPWSTGSMTF